LNRPVGVVEREEDDDGDRQEQIDDRRDRGEYDDVLAYPAGEPSHLDQLLGAGAPYVGGHEEHNRDHEHEGQRRGGGIVGDLVEPRVDDVADDRVLRASEQAAVDEVRPPG